MVGHRTIPILPYVYIEEYELKITPMGVPATTETYSLTCTVEGVSGSPTIQWFGPGGSEISTGVSFPTSLTSTLNFMDLSLSDAGEYTCRSTLTGVVREAVERIFVQSEPKSLKILHNTIG